MTPVWLALPIIAALAALAWMCVWSRRDSWARPAAVVLFLVSIPVVAWAGVETLGRHKPFDLARLVAGEYLILSAVMYQDKAIYLYAIDPARDEPRPLHLPWDNATAQAIQRALDGAPEGKEGKFILQLGEESGDLTAHPIPQRPAPPAKDVPEPGLTYVPPVGD